MLQEQLTEIVENKNEAETLYSILHLKAKPSDIDRSKPQGKKKFGGKMFKK